MSAAPIAERRTPQRRMGFEVLLASVLCWWLVALSAGAQPTPQSNNESLRIEIIHIKEMIALIEVKNDQRFKAQEAAVAAALASADRAVTKADMATEKRFESVNEFRNQLKDQTGTFITRGELLGWLIAMISVGFAALNTMMKRKPEAH